MLQTAYKHTRLMEASEARVEMAATLQSPDDALVANRVLACPVTFRNWVAGHDRLMHGVSDQSQFNRQVRALRETAFRLVHRRALFEYLRAHQVNGARRHRLFQLFYGCRHYSDAVLAEHTRYVRSSSSYLCTFYLAENLMEDGAFDAPLRTYEERYAEYFTTYCRVTLAATPEEQQASAALGALLPVLKSQLAELRTAILDVPQMPAQAWHDGERRRPTGDTQRLRALCGQLSGGH